MAILFVSSPDQTNTNGTPFLTWATERGRYFERKTPSSKAPQTVVLGRRKHVQHHEKARPPDKAHEEKDVGLPFERSPCQNYLCSAVQRPCLVLQRGKTLPNKNLRRSSSENISIWQLVNFRNCQNLREFNTSVVLSCTDPRMVIHMSEIHKVDDGQPSLPSFDGHGS